MAVIEKDLEKKLQELNMSMSLRDTKDYLNDNVSEENADEITIFDYNNGIDFRSYKLPKKKLVDLEWVMTKFNNNLVYVSFVNNFKKLLEEKGYKNSINVYPTTYGIGVFVAYNQRENIDTIRKDIESLLEEKNIEYRNEMSEGMYVLRYVISKKKENIAKLKD